MLVVTHDPTILIIVKNIYRVGFILNRMQLLLSLVFFMYINADLFVSY